MHRVHVVRVLERVEPLVVGALEDELGREGHGVDLRPHGRPRRDEHRQLRVGVGEQQRVRDAVEELRRHLVALVGDEEVGVVDRVEPHRVVDHQALEGELEARQRDDAQLLLRYGGGRAERRGLVVRRPRQHVREALDARHDRRERVEVRVGRRVQQVEQHQLLLVEVGRRHGRRRALLAARRGRRRLRGRRRGRRRRRRLLRGRPRRVGVDDRADGVEQRRHDDLGDAVALAPPLEWQQRDARQQLAQRAEVALDLLVGAGAKVVAAEAAEQLGDAAAQRKRRLEGLREEAVLLHELVEDRERVARRLVLARQPPLGEAQHDGARRREQRVAAAHLLEAAAVQCDVAADAEVDEDDLLLGVVLRVAAQVVGLVLPEGVPLEQRRRQQPVEQPPRHEGLDAVREVLGHRRLARDHGALDGVGHLVRVAALVPPPVGPRHLPVRDRRLQLAQAEARVARVVERAVVAAAVRLDPVDVHHPPRAVHEELEPHAVLLRLLGDEVRDLRVVGERLLGQEELQRLRQHHVRLADRLEHRRQPGLLGGEELLRVVGAPVLEGGHLGVDVPEGDRVRAPHQPVDLAVRRVVGEARLHRDVAEHVGDVLHLGDGVLERLRVRRHQRELHHLHVDDDRAVWLLGHRLHRLGRPRLGRRRARAARVDGEAAAVLVPRQVGPPLRHLAARRRQQLPRPLGDAHDRAEHAVELPLRRAGAQPRDELAPQRVHRLVQLVLGDAPRVVRRRAVPHVEQLLVPRVARREEGHRAHDRLGERLGELGRRQVAHHQQQVRVDDAHVPHVLVEDLLVLRREGLVELARQLVVPRQQQRPQLAEHRPAQLEPRRRQRVARAGREVEPAERPAADRVVRAAVVLQQEGDVVVEARAQPDHVQDDGRRARLEGARVEVGRLLRELEDALDEGARRAAQLVEQQVVRRAEQLGRRRRHVLRLELGGAARQVGARLEEDGVEQRLQLGHLQQVDAVLRREEGDDERHAQVRHRQVGEQQLGVVLAERLGRRVLDVLVAKVGQVPHVEQVVLALDARRARVLVGVGAAREAVRRQHLAPLDARLGGEQLRLRAGARRRVGADVELLLVPVEGELRLPLRVGALAREGGELRVEEELEVEGDVAVAAELGEVLDDEVVDVADVLRDVVDVGGEGEVLRDRAHPLDGLHLEAVGALPAVDLR